MKILEKEKEEKKKKYREGTERNGRTDKKQKCKKLCIVRGDKKKLTKQFNARIANGKQDYKKTSEEKDTRNTKNRSRRG